MRCHPIATKRPAPRATASPFVTRRSTLVFSLLSLAGGAGFQLVLGVDSDTTGTMGMLVAMLLALWIVAGVVAWIAGVILALRAGSLLWLVVSILPFPPLNSLLTALFCPPASPRRT